MSVESKVRAVTTLRLKEMKDRGEKIAMLTSYDYSMAKIVDAAGVDVILVGDSAANVMAGYETTVPITLDAMIYHARSVVRAVERALVVVDLPFGTYQGNSKMALDSAIRIMKETEADAVKLEGGEEILESVQRILSAGICIGEAKGKDFIPAEELALSTAPRPDAFPVADLDWDDAIRYLKKEALLLPAGTEKGYVLVRHKKFPLGFAKHLGNRANNLYPQEWRIRTGYVPEQVKTFE